MLVLRLLFVAALLPYLAWLVGSYEYHFLDHVNLAIHEAGHLLARPFGQTVHMLGGTLLQLVVPLVFVGNFWWRRRRFDAAICLLWFAESLMYTAAYLGDAYLMQLPLVGGEIHDWNWMLSRFGLVHSCTSIAQGVHIVASLTALGSVLGAGWAALAERSSQLSASRV